MRHRKSKWSADELSDIEKKRRKIEEAMQGKSIEREIIFMALFVVILGALVLGIMFTMLKGVLG